MKTATLNEMVFPARLEELANICQVVTEAARSVGMGDKNIWKLETAVDEACTNITCYGYKGRDNGTIKLAWKREGDYFRITIEDEGIPFDQSQPTKPDLNSDLCERQTGGLGRFIMHQFLDDMHYEHRNNKNILTLVKKIHANGNGNLNGVNGKRNGCCRY
ncbi:MAG: ATP-binding protein [bacterium]|jgi:serine/threonine-protein kinase RsbW|nr:ATP-binding protein [Spirochaetales bacterium]